MKPTFWAWTLIALAGGGLIAAFAAFALRYQTVTGWFWELPIIFMGGMIAAGAGITLAIQHLRHPRLVAPALGACALMWLFFILSMFDIDLPGNADRWYKQVESVFVFSVCTFGIWSCAFLPVLAIEPVHRATRLLRRSALIALTVVAILWPIFFFTDEFIGYSPTPMRLALMLASIATTAVVLALPATLFLHRRASTDQRLRIRGLLCPRCDARCDVLDGQGCCAQCQLPIELDLREPRCACGYLLLNLNGTTCPECGRTFGAQIRYELTSV